MSNEAEPPSAPSVIEVQDRDFNRNIREHEPSDSFKELMDSNQKHIGDSNQTHIGTVKISSFDEQGRPLTSLPKFSMRTITTGLKYAHHIVSSSLHRPRALLTSARPQSYSRQESKGRL